MLNDSHAGVTPLSAVEPLATGTGANYVFPVTSAQQRLWFLDQLHPGDVSYLIPWSIRIRGNLNATALECALDEIVSRHEVFRTTFSLIDDQLMQVVTESLHVPLPLDDLSSPQLGEGEVRRLSRNEALRPLDLAKGPLITARLLRLGAVDHVLLLTLHHIIFDRWSRGVWIRELSVLYEAFLDGRASPLPELKLQYPDYAVWQREYMEGKVLETHLNYWKRQLADAPAELTLPTDRPRPPVQSFHGAVKVFRLSANLTERLSQFSQQRGATLFMTLLTAFQALLSRYSGQEDVVVGVPISGRNRLELEDLIGLFANTLALRLNLLGNPTFSELVERTRIVALDAYKYQDLPFERLVQDLNPERSLSRNPVFQVVFSLGNVPEQSFRMHGLDLQWMRGTEATAKFDISVVMRQHQDHLTGAFEFSTELFDGATIDRMLDHYRMVLEAVVQNPDLRLSEFPLVTEDERHRLLVEWNETETEYPLKCVHELFETQVRQDPDAIALIGGAARMTYGELNDRADRLAAQLREVCIGRDVVGIYIDRSPEAIMSIIAVLKAGCAYLPLDPAYPSERLAFLAENAQARVILTLSRLADRMPKKWSRVLCVDRPDEWELPTNGASTKPQIDDLAYLMYTSGSTGEPKAVEIPHRAIVRLLFGVDYATFGNNEVFLQMAPLSFDASTFEIWGALLHGGQLVLYPDSVPTTDGLKAVLASERVTTLWLTTSLFNMVMDHSPNILSSLRQLLVGGEVLSVKHIARALELLPDTQLINGYGPTESTTFTTCYRIPRDLDANTASIPLGRPIGNTTAYVLDRHLQLVPIGVAGELYIGGDGLARGYLGQPEMTARKFIPHPFSKVQSDRLYASGDLVRYLPDGRLEFIRRLDDQVKLRGFRIELGEVESALSQHPAVKDCVVFVREDVPGDKRLVAYLVLHTGAQVTPLELNGFARVFLAEYMIPSAYVRMDSLPLTANGKLNRSALPAPAEDAYAVCAYEAPQGDIETLLAGIWAEALKKERIGRHDNFFALGGHSLLMITVIERVRQAGLQMELRTLFATPTLAELAAAVDHHGQGIRVPPNQIPPGCETITPEMLPLVRLTEADIDLIVHGVPGGAANVQDVYPLAPLQEGILFHHLVGGEGDPYLLARMFTFDSRERLNAYVAALQAVIDRHDVLRTAIMWERLPEPVQVVWCKAAMAIEEIVADPAAGDVSLQLNERFNPRRYRIDVRQAPLLRLYIAHDPAQGRWVMMELFHHLAGDHSTRELMRNEVQAHLLGQQARLPSPLPFRNLVAQARLGVSREEHEAFFREMLGEVDEPTAPFGLLDVRGDGTGINQARLQVEPELAQRIRLRARSLGASAASLWHLAFAQVLARASGREDVVFGTVLFGRMQGGEGSDRVMGLFMNTLPVRIRTGREGVETSVRNTQAILADLMRHEHASLALAQRCSAVVAPAPLFSALLNYRHSSAPSRIRSEEEIRAWEGIQLLSADERTNYPLMLSVDDLGEDFRLTVQVKAGIEPLRVCGYVHTAMRSLVDALETSPSMEVRRLDVLPEAERNQVLYGWNDTNSEYPQGLCLHQLFEAQATRGPGRPALTAGGLEISYGELNARANRLAHYLRRRGAGPDVPIGICIERTIDMAVGLLGILKAGSAYVPLDPDYPSERLRHILEDAQVHLVVTSSSLKDSLPGFSGDQIRMDTDLEDFDRESKDNPLRISAPENLAYVLYTSGSTGKPKGVQISHRNVVNFLTSMQKEPGISPEERLLAVTTLSFDIAGLEIYLPLVTGAQVILASREQSRDAGQLLDLLEHWQPTIMQATPATWWMLLEAGWKGNSQLKVLCGGEALPVELAERLIPLCGSLWNMYGPTETTIWSAIYRLESVATRTIPIGRPIANTTMYVLDERRQPVPIGVKGELYIGGDGVARGYLNRPELTAQQFGPDPYRTGGRMYRTGDVAKFLPDGNLLCLGRTDHQVKIRGFRIELGEIESILGRHPAVKDCVVIAREDVPGDKRLVAYLVGRTGGSDSLPDFRSWLQDRLPEYMVPSAFVWLPALPLTPSGKIDRKALPAPEYSLSDASEYVAARTPLEEKLVSIWSDALKLPQIGVHDDFFELGGHSLLAVELFARIEREMGEKLPLNLLFSAPTVAKVASRMRLREWQPGETSIKPCRTGGARPPVFAAHGIGGTVLTFRALARHLHADQPIYALEALDINQGWTSLKELASHYARDIRAFQPEGPYHLIGSSFGGMVAFEIARQLRAEGLEVGLVGLLDSYNMGARNLLSNRERFERQAKFVYTRVLMHLKRFPDRSLSQWPRYAVGRILAVGRRVHGTLWRIAYKSYTATPANKLPILRNIKRTFELAGMSYVPQVCPGKVVLFRRKEQVTEQQIQRQHGWTGLASGGLEIIEIPGDHNSILSEPHVKVLAQELTRWLDNYATDVAAPHRESAQSPEHSAQTKD